MFLLVIGLSSTSRYHQQNVAVSLSRGCINRSFDVVDHFMSLQRKRCQQCLSFSTYCVQQRTLMSM